MLRANTILFNKRGNAACCRDRRQATVSGRWTLPCGGGVLIVGRVAVAVWSRGRWRGARVRDGGGGLLAETSGVREAPRCRATARPPAAGNAAGPVYASTRQ